MKTIKDTDKIRVFGTTFRDIREVVLYSLDKKAKDGVFVGHCEEHYPCFDSSDYLTDDHWFRYFVFAQSKEELEIKTQELKRTMNITEKLGPMAYWYDAHDDVVLTDNMGENLTWYLKKYFLWFDLALCSLWTMVVLGSRVTWFTNVAMWAVMLMVLLRVLLSFALCYGEKKAWLSGLLFYGISALFACTGLKTGVTELTSKVASVADVSIDGQCLAALNVAMAVWLWVVPAIVFGINVLRKRMSDNLTWCEALGRLLWTDKRAKTFSCLLLVAVGTLFAGLITDARLCMFACIVGPTVSLFMLNRYYSNYGLTNTNLWVIVLAMLIFFFAQTHCGVWRMAMLGVSFCMVAYVGSCFFRKRLWVLSVLSTAYLGILLPSLAIGNNQYTCLNYARTSYNSLDSYPGIFYIEDKNNEMVGLRDRYGLLVEPRYEAVVYHTPKHMWGELELRRNGYNTLYDICNNRYRVDNSINHRLQDTVCRLVEEHLAAFKYSYDDRIDVRVQDLNTYKTLTHIKALKNGPVVYYDYNATPYIPTDSVAHVPETMVCDTLVKFEWCQKKSLSYLHNVKIGDASAYSVLIIMARDKMPNAQEAERLAARISKELE